ncbi:MAG TPA: GntR family transcriptional regulator [Chthonomonadaceae bacterium]|nr:GntR family transcriptional regulator [Chthonomonadaceae bacterium]
MSLAPATPKHREVERQLRSEILAGVWSVGERIPAEPALARRFGVAYMTVRQAVSSLVTEGLLQRVNGKGTFVLPQRTPDISAGTSAPLALLVPGLWQRYDPLYFPDVRSGFEEGMRQAEQPFTLLDSADAITADTIVACLLADKEDVRLIERLKDRGCRVIAINRYAGRRVIPSIAIDNAGGTALAVEHLVSLGHARIGFLSGWPGNVDGAERKRGFVTAMRAHRLPADLEAGRGFREERGYQGAVELLARPDRPTALVAASDLAAIGAIKAAQDSGLSVPGDLSVVGFGDFSVAAYWPVGLTTIYQPRRELGVAAAHALVTLRHGETVRNRLLPMHLIERGTTGPPC